MPKYSGAAWFQSACGKELGRELTDFEKRVADLIGQAELGFYHLSEKEYWGGGCKWERDFVVIHRDSGMATWDGNVLTRYVMLAHILSIRLDITPMIQFCETDHDDFESTTVLDEVSQHVCPAGYGNEGYVEDDIEREIANVDFDKDEPESDDNKKTRKIKVVRSGRAVLQLMFHQRKPHDGIGKMSFSEHHPTLDQACKMIESLAAPIMPTEYIQVPEPSDPNPTVCNEGPVNNGT